MAAKIKGGQALLDPAVQAKMGISAEIVNALLSKLADSIIFIFQWAVILPVLAIVFALLMGRARLEIAKQARKAHLENKALRAMEPANPSLPTEEVSLHVHEVNDTGALDGT